MPTSRPRLLVHVSDAATVVEVEDALYLRLDAEGRWTGYAEGGGLFRRTVEGRVVRAVGQGFETLSESQAHVVHGLVGRRAGALLPSIDQADDVTGDLERARSRLALAAGWTRARLEGERRRFQEAYPESIPILPPHRYRDLVLIPATGCPNHGCTFCRMYRDQPFRVLPDDAFDAHLEAVRDLFGAALAERDGFFLGSASALSVPDDTLGPRLGRIGEVLGRPRRGIAAFLDPDRAPARTAAGWAALGERGLREATLGLETGDPALRAAWGKRGDLSRFRRSVGALSDGGMQVVLTVLTGIGPAEAEHRDATARFVESLGLGEGDRVYCSPLDGTPEADFDAWRKVLGGVTGARIGRYRVERFAWLA